VNEPTVIDVCVAGTASGAPVSAGVGVLLLVVAALNEGAEVSAAVVLEPPQAASASATTTRSSASTNATDAPDPDVHGLFMTRPFPFAPWLPCRSVASKHEDRPRGPVSPVAPRRTTVAVVVRPADHGLPY